MFTRYFSSLEKEGITVLGAQMDLLVLQANNNDRQACPHVDRWSGILGLARCLAACHALS